MLGRGISLRAELARAALRRFVKQRARQQTIEDARRNFRRFEALVPGPPRAVSTAAVDAGGVRGDLVATPQSRRDRVILYLHGGAYRVGSPAIYRHVTWRIARAARARLLAIDYRLAPEHPFPAALEDAASAYRSLTANGAEHVAVAGDSAGGGLALALLLKLRDDGVPLPVAAAAMSPWTDLALTGASLVSNAEADPLLHADDIPRVAADYLAGADARNPYASPLYGDPTGLPPTLIQVGSDEILRDDAVRMAQKMSEAGVTVELEIWPRMPHVWHALAPFVPEAVSAIDKIGQFLAQNFAGARAR